MKRLLPGVIVLSLFGSFIPTFLAPEWGKIEPVEWQPLPAPGLDAKIVDEPEAIDPGAIEQTVAWRLLNTDINVQARYLTLPGSEELNAEIYAVVRGAIKNQADAVGGSYSPHAHAPGSGLGDRGCARGSTSIDAKKLLNDPSLGPLGGSGSAITCDVVFAAGPLYAQRLRTVTGNAGEVTSDVSVTIYQDSDSQKSWLAGDAWAEGASQYIWDSLIATLKQDAGALSVFGISSAPDEAIVEAAMNSTVADTNGDLLLTFAPGVESPELKDLGIAKTEKTVTLKLPGQQVGAYLSDLGTQLVDVAKEDAIHYAPPYVYAGNDYIDCQLVPCVAVTYDDGPSGYTPGILDAYAINHSAATFYVLGALAQSNPDVLARAHAEGHLVHGHSWDHPELTLLPLEEATRQINQTNTVIYEATGEVPETFRPPYGSINDAILNAVHMPAIMWDVDTNDWQGPPEDILIQRAVYDAIPGSIVLQHDIQPNTAATVHEVIAGLKDRGFSLVNLKQLFDGKLPTSGVVRSAY